MEKKTTIINHVEYEMCPCCNKPISGTGKSLGGMAIWVVKAFVRKGRIVDFPGDWRRLCESQGFVTVCEHHAMLVKETKHNGLFEEITETKERKSFFRRLAEKKGSPKIDYEVVLCSEKIGRAGSVV